MSTYFKICLGIVIGLLIGSAISTHAIYGYREMLGAKSFDAVRQQIYECEKALPRDQHCKATIRVEIAQ